MDIQNMQALLDTFASLGFSSATEYQLLYHACLRQKAFSIKEQKVFGTNIVSYSIFLKIKDSENKLICPYYDASLRKEIRIESVSVNGIDSDELEKRNIHHSELLVDANLMSNAYDAENREHEMSVTEAVKTHPMACFWAFIFCFTIVSSDLP